MKKRPYISHSLEIRYHDNLPGGSSIASQLQRVFDLLEGTASSDPLLRPDHWFIATGEMESSYLYRAFEAAGPATPALSVLVENNRQATALQSFSLWNGSYERTKGSSISCLFKREDGRSSSLTLSMDSAPDDFRLGGADEGIKIMEEAVRIYDPVCCAFGAEQYDPVFPDRPGVGWMLYLPLVLTVQQVPEARALVPVMRKDVKGKNVQAGTIIVSVTDVPFSDENPEHVKIANAIEVRLVDQDLLPRHADL